jgi:ribosomal RNA-processing protein 17
VLELTREYLTGFHKRKVERKQQAAERAKEVAHQEMLAERKKLREERRVAVEKDMKRFHEAMREVGSFGDDEDVHSKDPEDSSDFSDWEGIQDSKSEGILRKKQHYEDDDGITTVTVEDIEPKREVDDYVDLGRTEEVLKESLQKAEYAGKMMEFQSRVAKSGPRKKKFRYLTKTERKQNVKKERNRSKEKKSRGKSR